MPVEGSELASLDFANLIGGPLNAVIEAQAKAAMTTADFIKAVGFDKDGEVNNVNFQYTKDVPDPNDSSNTITKKFNLQVPFLTMVPIPYIRVDEALIEFNAKITSTTASSTNSTLGTDLTVDAKASYWFFSARVQSKTSYQQKKASSDREERSFDMHIRVIAKNEDLPAGTEKLLNMLESGMKETAGSGPIKSYIQPGDKFPVDTRVAASDSATAGKLSSYGYKAASGTTSWKKDEGFSIANSADTTKPFEFSWTGTAWKEGKAP